VDKSIRNYQKDYKIYHIINYMTTLKGAFKNTQTIIPTTSIINLSTETSSKSSLGLFDNEYTTTFLIIGLVVFVLAIGFILYAFFYLRWERKTQENELKKVAKEVEEMGGVIIDPKTPKTPRTPFSPDAELRKRIQTPDTPHFKDGDQGRNRDFWPASDY
jgi:hypothetical protein